MSKRRIAIFIVSFLCLSGALCAQSKATQTCKITGTVTDLSDAIFDGGRLFFLNAPSTYRAEIAHGKFEVDLPHGTYEILNEFQKRANLIVTCMSETPVHIYVLPACVSYGCRKLGADFDVFESKDATAEDANVVIAYYKKKKTRHNVKYESAVITYQNVTIAADGLVLDRNSRKATATGNCWIDDGFVKKKCVNNTLDIAPQILNIESTLKTVTDIENERFQHKFFWPDTVK